MRNTARLFVAREGLAWARMGASLAGGAVVVAVLRPFWPKNGEQL
jgi:hypothetical protein